MKRIVKVPSNSKAQAAMEFLMTYGWAIMMVLVVIAALAYFGVLDPSNIIPDRCYFGEKFDCTDYRFQVSGPVGTVYVVLTNKYNKVLNISGINISAPTGDCNVGGYSPWPFPPLNPGDTSPKTNIPCSAALNSIQLKSKIKFKVSIKYTILDSSISANRTDSGEILTKIER